jgi:HlyD family secretion protein
MLAAVVVSVWLLWPGAVQPRYQTSALARGDIEAAIAATGNCNAVVTVQVGSQVSGNVKALFADFNTQVKKGQIVALIDPEIFQARVAQARASLAIAQAAQRNSEANRRKNVADLAGAKANSLNQRANVARAKVTALDARAKLARRLQLFEAGVLSIEERDSAQATYDAAVAAQNAAEAQLEASVESFRAAEAQIDVAEAQQQTARAQLLQSEALLAQAETDLRHTEIRSPVDGIVIARRVDVGQTVAASFQAPTIFEIAQDLTKMQVDTNVDESDIGYVRLGQRATFTVDAYPGISFSGDVVQIRQAAINVQNVISYNVVIAVSNAGQKLFPGMTANVRILTETKRNVLKVPNAALRVRLGIGRQAGGTIWMLDGEGKPQSVNVRLGISDGLFSALEEGELSEGARVIVGTSSVGIAAPTRPGFGGPRI